MVDYIDVENAVRNSLHYFYSDIQQFKDELQRSLNYELKYSKEFCDKNVNYELIDNITTMTVKVLDIEYTFDKTKLIIVDSDGNIKSI